MINYDRTSNTLLLQFPDSAGKFTPHPGAVLQMTSSDFGLSWTEPTDISAMLGPVFSPGVSSKVIFNSTPKVACCLLLL